MTTTTHATFTPGKWAVWRERTNGSFVIIEGKQGLAVADALPMSSGATKANARLIAKAPELYAAMADLFEQCAMTHKHWGDGDNTKQADAAIDKARALLAEIQGRQTKDTTINRTDEYGRESVIHRTEPL